MGDRVQFHKITKKQAREAIRALPCHLQAVLDSARARFRNQENAMLVERARVSIAWLNLFKTMNKGIR